MAVFSRIKSPWMRFVHVLGHVQTTLLLSVIYVLILGPLALLLRLVGRGDLLSLHAPKAESFALAKQMVPTDVERCARQF